MNSKLAIIDPETMERKAMVSVCPTAHGIAIAADSSEAYVTCLATDELAVVQLTEPYAVERFPVGACGRRPRAPTVHEPYAASLNPVDGSVWVSCLKSGEVRIFHPGHRDLGDAHHRRRRALLRRLLERRLALPRPDPAGRTRWPSSTWTAAPSRPSCRSRPSSAARPMAP